MATHHLPVSSIASELSQEKIRALESRMRTGTLAPEAVVSTIGFHLETPSAARAGLAHSMAGSPGPREKGKRERVPSPSDDWAREGKQPARGCGRHPDDILKGPQAPEFHATAFSVATPPAPSAHAHLATATLPPPRHVASQTDALPEEAEIRRLREELFEAKARVDRSVAEVEPLREEIAQLRAREAHARVECVRWVRRMCRLEKAAAREAATRNSASLGTVGWQRVGANVTEVWEPGNAFREVHTRQADLQEAKEALERDRRSLAAASRKRVAAGASTTSAAATFTTNADVTAVSDNTGAQTPGHDGMASVRDCQDMLVEREEVLRLKAATLKRQEVSLADHAARLERDKQLHIRELKRIRDEDSSRFSAHQLLGERYLLLDLLGRGGFSEVYRAYDTHEHREVACKLHQLNPHWSDERKANYTRHATREYAIHKALRHDRIVALYDVLEIDAHTFATVLQFCNGGDLDGLLKEQRTLPEKEARAIIIQIFSGLRHLNAQRRRIIHYDLKPGNILFHDGEVKLTDFGLSKLMDEGLEASGMDLTSQGAGTYWYLPPECFAPPDGEERPKICAKVDVWSAGVVFYQMLFGKKPFGDNMSQESLFASHTMRNAAHVDFPAKPNPYLIGQKK